MPDCACSASIPDAQSFPEKFCPDCGVRVFGRTMDKQFCSDCGEARRKERDRLAAERRRRKSGIPKVKGEIFQCAECNSDFVATSKSRAKYCSGCRDVVALRSSRERSFQNDPTGRRKRFKGDEIPCSTCGNIFSPEIMAKTCAPCREARKVFDGWVDCSGCGTSFQSPTRKKRYCENCAKVRRGDAFRRFARKKFNEMSGDPAFDINTLMRSRMRHSLNGKKGRASWSDLVGYTVDELKSHLERQFLPGMTWENRGLNGWHIDHIIPIASFNYDGPEHPDFKACWALTNLRPMWAADNIRKKDKILYLL